MNAAPTSNRQQRPENRARTPAWKPAWAVVAAVVAALLLLYPFIFGIGLIVNTAIQDPGELGRELGYAIGGLAVVVSAVGLLPLGWFFRRGGVIPWALGMTVAAAAVAVFVSTL